MQLSRLILSILFPHSTCGSPVDILDFMSRGRRLWLWYEPRQSRGDSRGGSRRCGGYGSVIGGRQTGGAGYGKSTVSIKRFVVLRFDILRNTVHPSLKMEIMKIRDSVPLINLVHPVQNLDRNKVKFQSMRVNITFICKKFCNSASILL